ncbi:MAG: hypothetical protein V1493_01715 [Candidatus Diapherotrites archaeon]
MGSGMAELKRKHYLVIICFFCLLFVFGLFLLYNNLASGQGSGNGMLTPEPQPKPSGTPAPAPAKGGGPGLGFYVKNALENGADKCDAIPECQRLFSLAEKKCSGSLHEKIFCLAVFDSNTDYCGWIDVTWYSITCKAFFDANAGECLAIRPEDERLLCIQDLALNVPGLDCNVLPGVLAKECEGLKQEAGENAGIEES